MTRVVSTRVWTAVGCLLVAFLACVATLRAQQGQPPASPQQVDRQMPPVTFKAEINYVEVDAVVTDKQGNFVHGLGRDDFQVTEDGKSQKVSAFSYVNIPVEKVEKPLFARQAIEPDVQTNARGVDGRIYLIVLDDLHTAPLRSARVRAAARQFVQQQMGANDLAAVVYTSGRSDVAQEFTSNQALLAASINKFMGRKLRSATLERMDSYYQSRGMPTVSATDTLESERAYNARVAFDDMRQLSDFLASVHGRRKAMIYFGEGVDYNIYDQINNSFASDIRDSARDAIAAATRANVNIYTVDPRGLTDMGDEAIEMGSPVMDQDANGNAINISQQDMLDELRMSQDSMRTLSDETGGFAALNMNDFRNAFERIVQENSSYYVLGYYSTNDRRDGKFRRIDVKVNRPGVQLRFRKGYVAPTGKPAARRPVEHQAITSTEVREALESPIPMSGFTLSTFAAAFKGAQPNASVVITTQGSGRDLKFNQKGDRFEDLVEVSVVAVDHDGKIQGGDQQQLNMALKPETLARMQAAGFRMVSRINLAPGRYQLRVAARDANAGRIGSVYYDLMVPDFWKAPLSMSGVVITSARSSAVPTPRRDEELAKALPGPPTTTREFLGDDELAVLAEVYDNQAATAHKVNVGTTILAEDGRVVFRHGEERSSTELNGRNGGFGYVVRIPLKEIPPGLYVLRLEARSTLGKTDPVSREVQFTVRPAPKPQS